MAVQGAPIFEICCFWIALPILRVEVEVKYDVPVFAPSTEAELKATVTYRDFMENNTRFVIKRYRGAYSIFRTREDIRGINDMNQNFA